MKRFLAKIEPNEHRALEARLRELVAVWGADGWAIIGKPGRLRIAILVPRKLAQPSAAIREVKLPRSLGGGVLKPAVIATHNRAWDEHTAGVLPPGAGTTYLAPGSPIVGNNQRIGIGAVVSVAASVCIVTCGHTGGNALSTLDGTEVATLRSNYLPAGLDAAVYEVNDVGLTLLRAGRSADTWATRIHDPDANDNGRPSTFWPTWQANRSSFVEDVSSYATCLPGRAVCNSILLPRCTTGGDSGSTLQLDGDYYGLASFVYGNYSFFTSIASVKQRAPSMQPWRPT